MSTSSPETQPEPKDLRQKPRSPRILSTTLITAALVATLFVSFSPKAFSGGLNEQLSVFFTAEPNSVSVAGTTRPVVRIGIVSGHYGFDPGAVCENGTTEADVNFKISTLVQQKLDALGYETDLLKEKDERLEGYRAAVLVSIHNDSCDFVNDQATGFKVAAAMSTRDSNLASRLEGCLRDRYQRTTNMPWHNSVTNDMTFYHAFSEIHPNTPAGIIETGFLNLDYDILTNNTNMVANGVVNGILCFINNENIASTATP